MKLEKQKQDKKSSSCKCNKDGDFFEVYALSTIYETSDFLSEIMGSLYGGITYSQLKCLVTVGLHLIT